MDAELRISVTKPKGKPAQALAAQGIAVCPIQEDEGNVDRYVIGPRLVVERRTAGSFLLGIQDKTLFTSAIYLGEHFELAILLVEGAVDYERTGFHPQAVRGALTSMLLQYGLSVLTTKDVDETVALLAMLTRQEQIGIPEISLVPKRAASDLADQQRRVIEMLPHVGRVLARELLQRFGSVQRVIEATEAELRAVPGIGPKTAGEIARVARAEYRAVDIERDLEDALCSDPALLFPQPVDLLARQQVIYSEGGERHIVDLVFWDAAAREVILVELKHGKLLPEHEQQLRRYLTHAAESPLIGVLLGEGASLRGVLASVAPPPCVPMSPDITAAIVDREAVIEVLCRLRAQRLLDAAT